MRCEGCTLAILGKNGQCEAFTTSHFECEVFTFASGPGHAPPRTQRSPFNEASRIVTRGPRLFTGAKHGFAPGETALLHDKKPVCSVSAGRDFPDCPFEREIFVGDASQVQNAAA